jgi:PAS domain S-box-containing protein
MLVYGATKKTDFEWPDKAMTPIPWKVTGAAGISTLMGETAEIVASMLSVDRLLLLELGAINGQSCTCFSIGWEQSAAVRLGKRLLAQARQAESNQLQALSSGETPLHGGLYRPSLEFLQEYHLTAGLLASAPCGHGTLALFAGNTRAGSSYGESAACSLRAVVNLLSRTVMQWSAASALIGRLQAVLQAKQQWEAAIDVLPQLVCVLDEHGRVLRSNRTLELWQLGDVRSIRGTHVHDMLHPGCADPDCDLRLKWKRMWQQLSDAQFAECTLDNPNAHGQLHLSLLRSNASHNEDDAPERGYAFVLIEGIGQHKQQQRLLTDYSNDLQQQLEAQSTQLQTTGTQRDDETRERVWDMAMLIESAKKWACFVEHTLTGIYAVKNNRIVFCNTGFAEIFGYDRSEILRLEPCVLFPCDERRTTSNNGNEENPVEAVTKSGKRIWLRRGLRMIDCMSDSILLGSIVDVTAQKDAEDKLRDSEHELSLLSEQLLQAHEEERRRIALELHDSIGQSLSAIKFSLENTLRRCDQCERQQNEEDLAKVVDKLRAAISEVRDISMGLRPSMLDDLGLIATISWFCREFQARHPAIRLNRCVDADEGDIPDDLKVVIFRILQEAINNIAKHAGATHVSVDLVRRAGTLTMRIMDNGQGIAPEALRAERGLGLSSMTERARLSSGDLTVESRPGRGTVIQVVWPLALAVSKG